MYLNHHIGHDYCNYGEASLPCHGCNHIPLCIDYTRYGVELNHRPSHTRSQNMNKVVTAVQEWMIEEQLKSNISLHLYHTVENFTRETLQKVGLDYDLVITSTYNPSWYFIKP